MRELPAGPDAVLLDFSGEPRPADAVVAATATLRAAVDDGRLTGVTDLVPSAATLLVQADTRRGIDSLGIHRALREVGDFVDPSAAVDDTVEIPVSYDGPDLDAVAATLDLGVDEVIALHRDTRWRVQFMGFAPGFGYLVPVDADNPLTTLGRRAEPRTRVPAGAVAVAAGYSAVYPRESPGGWHLLGHTTIPMWDVDSEPPAILAPGRLVRFVDATDGRR